LGRWGMAAAHGNLHGTEAVVPREIQQFRVEAEALDGLLLENNPTTLTAERFEAALRVHKGQPENDAHDFVENDSGEFAEGGFVNNDEAAIDRAGANGHVVVGL